jgi:hypothetical protein
MGFTPQYWVIVGSKENYEISRSHGFTLQGIKSRHRKKAEQIQPGDKLIYYVTGVMALGGIVTVESPYFEESTPVWVCSSNKRAAELYPFRFKITPYLIPSQEEGLIPVEPLHSQLQYLKKWPEKNWTLGFQGNVHLWPEKDYRLVEHLFLKQKQTTPA